MLAVVRGFSAGLTALLGLVGCVASYPAPVDPAAQIPAEPPAFLHAADALPFVGLPGVSFVDARARKHWLRGHVPGAVQLAWTELREQGLLTGKLDKDPQITADAVGRAGVSRQDWVIVVGGGRDGWGEEGRIAWVLTWLGQEKVSVLDGGQAAWVAAGGAVQRGALRREPVQYLARSDGSVLAFREDVEAFVGPEDPRAVLLDVRQPDEYRGASSAPGWGATRRGHIPGAVNVPWAELLDEEGLLRSPDELGRILLPVGVHPGASIVTYCTGGVRSAHTWWVLRSLGYPDVRNYAGSWWEWALDRKLPIERGATLPRRRFLPPPPGFEDVAPESSGLLEPGAGVRPAAGVPDGAESGGEPLGEGGMGLTERARQRAGLPGSDEGVGGSPDVAGSASGSSPGAGSASGSTPGAGSVEGPPGTPTERMATSVGALQGWLEGGGPAPDAAKQTPTPSPAGRTERMGTSLEELRQRLGGQQDSDGEPDEEPSGDP